MKELPVEVTKHDDQPPAMPKLRITMRQLFECMFWLCVGFAAIALMSAQRPRNEPWTILAWLGFSGYGPAFGAAVGAIFGHQFRWALWGVVLGPIAYLYVKFILKL